MVQNSRLQERCEADLALDSRGASARLRDCRLGHAGVVVQELTVVAKGTAKARRIARVRRVVKRGGRTTLHIAVSQPGRKTLRGARTTLKATLRTTITLRSGRSTTIRRAVLLVPGRRR